MEEHLGYKKNSSLGNNSGNSRNGFNRKTVISDYGESEIAVPSDRNGGFSPRVLEKGGPEQAYGDGGLVTALNNIFRLEREAEVTGSVNRFV